MKTFLIIGAGRFGMHLAKNLCQMGNEVMIVDQDEKVINEISNTVTATEIGDFTVKSNLAALGVDDYDYVFVALSSFQNSLIIVDYLKELGAKFVIAKAASELHEKFLLKNGADKIVYPERDAGYMEAVTYSNNNVHDYIKLSDDAGIYEIEAPTKWCGKSLSGLNVRRIHNVSVIARRSGLSVYPINDPEYVFTKSEHIFVMGDKKDIRKLTKD